MKYSTAEIFILLQKVQNWNLYITEEYKKLSPDDIRKLANGIGPDRWPGWVRDTTTDILYLFEAAALVHDVDYSTMPDRTLDGWHTANYTFWYNCLICIKKQIPWYRIISRKLARDTARLLCDAVESRAGKEACKAAGGMVAVMRIIL